MAPSNGQWDDAVRNYCLNILKVKKVAVIGDTTGYGVTAVGASVAAFKKDGADVVYQANIDATQPDLTPDLLRARNAGAEVIVVWSVTTGMEARMFNTRAAMSWDVAFVGHPSLSSGEIAGLVEKPANWEKVYAVGYKSCSYDGAGKLPARTQDLVDRLTKAKVAMNDTLLWWIAGGVDAIELMAKGVEASGSTDSEGLIKYWNTLSKYPGYFGTYTFSPTQHNGYPTDEIVMSAASTAKNGTFALAPGYS
jgi:branched-chain amino acid transport system substrate-binding protein